MLLKVIGYALIVAPFIGIAWIGIATIGPWPTVGVFAVTGVVVATIMIGVTLVAA